MKKRIIAMAAVALSAASALADTAPQYPGGDEAMQAFISENMQYPQRAKQNEIEGQIPLSVQIKADGTIGSIKIVRMLDPDLEQEAIRLVKMMPRWIPAEQGGKAVDAPAAITIFFQLPGEE